MDIPDVDKVSEVKLYFKDLGPQVAWSTTFYAEYAGPPIVYALVWALRQPGLITGLNLAPMMDNFGLRQLALACYVGHFLKRLFETRFIHRFSHATMPISSFVRNCAYYWLFALAIAYFTNHPLYMAPCKSFFSGAYLVYTPQCWKQILAKHLRVLCIRGPVHSKLHSHFVNRFCSFFAIAFGMPQVYAGLGIFLVSFRLLIAKTCSNLHRDMGVYLSRGSCV